MGEVPDREDGNGLGADDDIDDDDLDGDGDGDDVDGGGESDLDDERDAGGDESGDGGTHGVVAEPREPLPLLDVSALPGVLEFLAKGLVDNEDAVGVELVDRDGGVTLRLSVDQPDMGKVIGRSGRTAKAIRVLMRAAGVRAGVSTHVEIVESEHE